MLSRWDPFREMISMRRAMDRLIDGSLSGQDQMSEVQWSLPLDVIEHDNEFIVKASLPGVKPDDIDVTFDKGMLTIKGQVMNESENEEGEYHLRERSYGTFTRTISLPSTIKADDIQANFNDGILTLELPKSEEVKPKRIAVNKGQQKSIDVKATSGKEQPTSKKENSREKMS